MGEHICQYIWDTKFGSILCNTISSVSHFALWKDLGELSPSIMWGKHRLFKPTSPHFGVYHLNGIYNHMHTHIQFQIHKIACSENWKPWQIMSKVGNMEDFYLFITFFLFLLRVGVGRIIRFSYSIQVNMVNNLSMGEVPWGSVDCLD